jgi:hypothetical protein
VLPDDALPASWDDTGAADAQPGHSNNVRSKLRPDIMLVEVSQEEFAKWVAGESVGRLCPTHDTRPRRVWIVEIGYCSDTRYEAKLDEKRAQHSQLQAALQSYGYDVTLIPMVLGNTGTVYTTNLEGLMQLGMSREKGKKLLAQLHTHAVACTHNIVKSRRFLERQVLQQRHHRPKRKRYDPP